MPQPQKNNWYISRIESLKKRMKKKMDMAYEYNDKILICIVVRNQLERGRGRRRAEICHNEHSFRSKYSQIAIDIGHPPTHTER